MSGEQGIISPLPTIVVLSEATGGGVMRHILDLYRGLTSVGFPVRLILSPRRIDERYKDELNAIPAAHLTYVTIHRKPHPSDLLALKIVSDVLDAIDGSVVLHAHSTKAGFLGSLLRNKRVARVLTPHAYRGTDPKLAGLSRRVVELIERTYSRSYDRVVAEVPQEYAYARKIGIAADRLCLIPNGVDLRQADFEAIRAKREQRPRTLVLGFVGRLVYQKNPLLFLEVMRELSERGCHAKAILFGEGPLRAEMDALAVRYGLTAQLDWRGERPAAAVYPDMDVMVHTSLYEALPYALIEACAALLPIVATRNPGSEAILGESLPQNLVPQQDARAAAECILRLWGDAHEYKLQMTALARIAQNYSISMMIDRYKALFIDVSNRVPARKFAPLRGV